MGELIIDTNVPLMADGSGMSPSCHLACVQLVEDVIQGKFLLVIDDQWHCIREYENKMPKQTRESWSRKFLKHVYTHQANPKKLKQVRVTPLGDSDFEEFPDSLRAEGFDMSDRKFVAVAIANGGNASIAQASDSKWIGWEDGLKKVGVNVLFLCKDELRDTFQKKMG